MFCENCGFDNEKQAKFCQKCGKPLNDYDDIRKRNYFPQTNYPPHNNNTNLIIICITIILITAIIMGTFLFLMNNNEENSLNNNQNNQLLNTSTNLNLKVNTVTFYSDGNPNTGETATINVGEEHSGEVINIITTYFRNGANLNNPTFKDYTVDNEGNIKITDYTPMPKYPDRCIIKINTNTKVLEFECDIGTYKGSQTSIPRMIE